MQLLSGGRKQFCSSEKKDIVIKMRHYTTIFRNFQCFIKISNSKEYTDNSSSTGNSDFVVTIMNKTGVNITIAVMSTFGKIYLISKFLSL